MIITLRLKSVVIFMVIIAIAVTSICFVFAKDEGVEVPIIMYHSIQKDETKSGKFVITPTEFEEDLKFLKENGYTTIVMEDLINYVKNEGELPEKPVILTFDDGCYNNYVYAYPLAKKYNMKMVFSIVGAYADQYSKTNEENANYSYLTWDRIRELNDSGIVEIQNHSYDMHKMNEGRNGSKKNKGESKEHYKNIFTNDTNKNQTLLKEKAGVTATTYTYPFGGVSNDSMDILKEMGFTATLSCAEGTNHINRGDQLYMLKRYVRPHKKCIREILKRQNSQTNVEISRNYYVDC